MLRTHGFPGSRASERPIGKGVLYVYSQNHVLATTLPEFTPHWTVRKGIEQLHTVFVRHTLTPEGFQGTRYMRIKHIRALQNNRQLDANLRWAAANAVAGNVSQ